MYEKPVPNSFRKLSKSSSIKFFNTFSLILFLSRLFLLYITIGFSDSFNFGDGVDVILHKDIMKG